MKKIVKIAAVLVLALLVSGMAFASGGSSTTNARQDLTPLKRYDTPVRMTVGRESNAGGQFAAGQTSEDNGWTRMLKEVLNIEIDVRNGFEVVGGDYDQLLALRVASDRLPDTFGISDNARGMNMFYNLVEGRKLADLTNLFPAVVGGMTRAYLDTLNLRELNQYMTVNNRLYGIHSGREGYNTGLLWVRKDWLDKCNLPVPRTMDDIANVAREFVRQRPGGQANTIGLAFNPDPNGGIFGQWLGILPLFNAFGSYPDLWIRNAAGQIVNGAIQPETKEALRLLASWVQSGVIDRNMVTMRNGDEVRDTYISTNACGMYFQAWWDPWVTWDSLQAASVKFTQGVEWVPVMAPLNPQGKWSPKNESISLGGQVIRAGFSNPEAVIKAINLFEEVNKFRNPVYEPYRDIFIKPIEGQTDGRTNSPFRNGLVTLMDRVEGAPIITDYLRTGRLTLPETSIAFGIKDYIEGAYNWERNNTMANWYRSRNDAEAEQYMFQYVGHWAFDVVMNMYLEAERTGLMVEKIPAFTGTTDTHIEVGAMLDDLRNTAFMQIISGARPIDYFDTFVADWRRLGGDTVTAEVNAAVRR